MMSEQVQVQTATVQVQVLTIGERQVTAGIIRQVPEAWCSLNDPPPWVEYACGVGGKCDQATRHHVHFLWITEGGELRRGVASAPQSARQFRKAMGLSDFQTLTAEDREELAAQNEMDQEELDRATGLPYVYAAGMR